ncbi:RNA-binding domain-containing protein [Virgibacillus natechei]
MEFYELKSLLDYFRGLPSEVEWLEFKEAKINYNFDKIGRYFSAISNEANLKEKKEGWLIFGVNDSNRDIVGSKYKEKRSELENLKQEIAQQTNNNLTFKEIHELDLLEGRVIMFQIPAGPIGVPISWKGHYYGRDGESLSPLNIHELETIRSQQRNIDWSAQIIKDATLDDLDEEAILKARKEYKIKNQKVPEEDIDSWSDETFLNKAKITIKGQITRTAILLLGRPESDHFLSPSIAKLSWILKDEDDIERDYEHFGPPLLLNTDLLFNKIRNLKYRYMPDQSLFPIEINQYDSYVIREALHNCIAHQDYELMGRINVVEKPEELVFTNVGSFIPKTIENVINQDAPQEFYRNRWLAEGMVNLNMIDTIGSGIRKMFLLQKKRFFPLPDYNLDNDKRVTVKIFGKIIDLNYTKMLINYTDLGLDTVILLDKVQKGKSISKEQSGKLRKNKLIEGRYPSIYVSSKIAALTGDKSAYIKNRAFDKEHYKKMIISFIKEYNSASRQEINDLLLEKLSDALNETQKKKKITNLLYEMHKKDQTIKNLGSNKKPKWVLMS